MPTFAVGSNQIDEIIGLPPIATPTEISGFASKHQQFVIDTMPILYMRPMLPEFTLSLQGYRLKPAWKKYMKRLATLGPNYTYTGRNWIKFAHLAVNPPTEQFSNTFGKSQLHSGFEQFSETLTDLSFTAGGSEGMKAGLGAAKDMIGNIPGAGGAMDAIGTGIKKGATDLSGAIGRGLNMKQGQIESKQRSMGKTMEELALGSKIDFPDVWKSSDMSPSYSVNIRLYNPNPANVEWHDNRIVGPLSMLLLFVVPHSADGETYKWPYLCKFRMPGIVQEFAGYVKSISVVKGGDDNVISYLQRPVIVDVKLDLGILYSTMLDQADPSSGPRDIPRLNDYIDELRKDKDISPWDWTAGLYNTSDDTLDVSNIAANTGANVEVVDRDNPPTRVVENVEESDMQLQGDTTRMAEAVEQSLVDGGELAYQSIDELQAGDLIIGPNPTGATNAYLLGQTTLAQSEAYMKTSKTFAGDIAATTSISPTAQALALLCETQSSAAEEKITLSGTAAGEAATYMAAANGAEAANSSYISQVLAEEGAILTAAAERTSKKLQKELA